MVCIVPKYRTNNYPAVSSIWRDIHFEIQDANIKHSMGNFSTCENIEFSSPEYSRTDQSPVEIRPRTQSPGAFAALNPTGIWQLPSKLLFVYPLFLLTRREHRRLLEYVGYRV
jgi:hypothetical protein